MRLSIGRRGVPVGLALMATLGGCAPEHQDVGSYRIVTATDGLGGLRCQPRTELYYRAEAAAGSSPAYLGTCGTPRFVTKHLHLPGDPSCFAVADGGSSLVYLHRPALCGAGAKARAKPAGVYVHSVADGDRFLYRQPEDVGQVWSAKEIPAHAIRVSWNGAMPSRGGASCPQSLIIHADGREEPEGVADSTLPHCRARRDRLP